MSDFPNVFRRVSSLAKAIKEASSHYIEHGYFETPDQLKEARLAICSTCPFNKENWCMDCGCHIPTKAALVTEHCDLGNWPAPILKGN